MSSDGNITHFEKIITNESPFQVKFDQGNMVFLTKFAISHSNPGSNDKKLKCFATYDTFAPDSDDESTDGTFTGRESTELACFVIGHKINEVKIEYVFSAGMHPVFSVEGPGSIKIEGFLKYGTELDDDFNPEEEEQSDSPRNKSSEPEVNSTEYNILEQSNENVKNEQQENITEKVEKIEEPIDHEIDLDKNEKTLTRPPDDEKTTGDDPDWLSGETSEGM